MSLADSQMTREVLRDISKRPLDITGLEVHVCRGVVFLRGKLDKLRGYFEDIDVHEELNIITKLLRQKPGVRDVVCEVECIGPSALEQSCHHKKIHHSWRTAE